LLVIHYDALQRSVMHLLTHTCATPILYHFAGRHNKSSTIADIWQKKDDMHSCKVVAVSESHPQYDPDRPLKAFGFWRARNYGDEPYMPENGIELIPVWPANAKPGVAPLLHRDESERAGVAASIQRQLQASRQFAAARARDIGGGAAAREVEDE
jgi:hypothetical protein